MEYSANWYERLSPLGRYDRAAIAFGYGELVEAYAGAPKPSAPREVLRYYQGGEPCQTDADCPYSLQGERAVELSFGLAAGSYATALVRERAPELLVEGPIQYDAAIDVAVARTKLPESEVAGRATVFIFPDLNTGNNTYKAVQRSAGAVAVGPVLQGLRKPVNDLSRGATVRDIVNTVAITAIQAQKLTGAGA